MERNLDCQNVKEFSLRDFMKIFPSLIPENKIVVVGSDFDETICSNYIYDKESSSHLPVLSTDLLDLTQKTSIPIIIATARSPQDFAFWRITKRLLGGRNLPVVCENGSLIFFPNDSFKKPISLLSEGQNKELKRLQKQLPNLHLNDHFSNQGAEVLIRNHRMTSIDFRIQNIKTKVGMPDLHEDLENFINSQFNLDGFIAVSSLNSLSVQPKNSNKLNGVVKALETINLERKEIFLIGMGDAPNDKELLEGADLGIAVRSGASKNADIFVDAGENVILNVLELLK